MDLTKLSLLELKALGFDIQNQLAQFQQNLQILAGEIQKRQSEPAPTEEVPPAQEVTAEPEAV